jgi:hypothetical protein
LILNVISFLLSSFKATKNLFKMKKIKFLLVSTAVLLISVARAQTTDDIINKHVNAIGGIETIGKLKSVYTENSMEAMGSSSPAFEYLLEGKGFKSESEFNGMKIINTYNDKGGWLINPFLGSSDAQAMPDDAYKAGRDQIYFGGSLINYAAKGNKVELAGKEGNNYKLKVTNAGTETSYFIDASTYLVTKTVAKGEMMGQPIEITISYSDYKKTDFGIVVPYARTVDFGGFALSYKVTKVEVNKELDPKIFEMPK